MYIMKYNDRSIFGYNKHLVTFKQKYSGYHKTACRKEKHYEKNN